MATAQAVIPHSAKESKNSYYTKTKKEWAQDEVTLKTPMGGTFQPIRPRPNGLSMGNY